MGLEVGTLSVRLNAELNELQTGLTRSASMVKGYSAQVEGYLQSHREEWTRMGKAASLALSATAYAFARMAKEAANYADEIQRAARGTGLSLQMIQQLKYAAEISEGSLEGMVKIIAKLASASADAVGGNEKAADAFKILGISATDSNGKLRPGIDLLFELSDKYKGGKITAEQFAAALDLVGMRGASSYLPMLAEGSARLKELMSQSEKYGNLTDEQINSLDKYGDELARINKTMMVFKAGIAEDLLPLMPMLQRQILRTSEGWAGWNIVLDTILIKFIQLADGFDILGAKAALMNPFGHKFMGMTASEWLAGADTGAKQVNNLEADIKAQQAKIQALYKNIQGIKDYDPNAPVPKPGPGGLSDEGDLDSELSAQKALREEKEKLAKEWYLEVIRMTDGETAYKLAALEIERKEIQDKYASDKQVLADYASYYKLKVAEINAEPEKKLQEEKGKLLKEWNLDVIKMTQGETAYKIAALEEERREIEKKFGKDKQTLDAYTVYYKTKLGEIKNTKSDMVSEFIGAFEWKPANILAGGGREFGRQKTLDDVTKELDALKKLSDKAAQGLTIPVDYGPVPPQPFIPPLPAMVIPVEYGTPPSSIFSKISTPEGYDVKPPTIPEITGLTVPVDYDVTKPKSGGWDEKESKKMYDRLYNVPGQLYSGGWGDIEAERNKELTEELNKILSRAIERNPLGMLRADNFKTQMPIVNQQGNVTTLQLTVHVQGRSELHGEIDRQLDRLEICN